MPSVELQAATAPCLLQYPMIAKTWSALIGST